MLIFKKSIVKACEGSYMKYFITILILLIAIAALQGCDSTKNIAGEFYKANEAYTKKDYKKAREVYLSMTKTINAPELYFNLANSYWNMDDEGYALYYYDKARSLAPRDKEIITVSESVKAYLKQNGAILERPSPIILSLNELSGIWIIYWILQAYIMILYFRKKNNALIHNISLIIFIAITIAVFAGIYDNKTYATIITPSSELRSSPYIESEAIQIIPRGSQLEITQEDLHFVEVSIKYPKIKGWLPKKDILY